MQTRHLKVFEWISNLLNSLVLLIASSFYNTNPQPFELAWSKGDASQRRCWWSYQQSPPTMHRTGGTAGKWANWPHGTPAHAQALVPIGENWKEQVNRNINSFT